MMMYVSLLSLDDRYVADWNVDVVCMEVLRVCGCNWNSFWWRRGCLDLWTKGSIQILISVECGG